MVFTILQALVEEDQGDLYFISGLLMVITPLLALGIPLLTLRRIPREERGPWTRGMLTTAFPAIVVCIVVASLTAPTWVDRNYVKDAYNAAELYREPAQLSGIILRTAILGTGTALLIWLGGFLNHLLHRNDET